MNYDNEDITKAVTLIKEICTTCEKCELCPFYSNYSLECMIVEQPSEWNINPKTISVFKVLE